MIPLFHACGTVSTPCSRASSAIRSSSVMPPQRVTSGWTRSTWPRSISSRKPHTRRVLLAGGDADVDRVGELGVRLVLVRARTAPRARRRRAARARARRRSRSSRRRRSRGRRRSGCRPSPAASFAAAASATSCFGILAERPPTELDAVKPSSRSCRDAFRRLLGRVRHQHRGVGAHACRASRRRAARRPACPAALPLMSQSAMSMPLIAWSAIPRRPM